MVILKLLSIVIHSYLNMSANNVHVVYFGTHQISNPAKIVKFPANVKPVNTKEKLRFHT